VEGLEDTHMKNIMNAGALRQLKTIGDIAHPVDDLKRTSIPWPELATASRQE